MQREGRFTHFILYAGKRLGVLHVIIYTRRTTADAVLIKTTTAIFVVHNIVDQQWSFTRPTDRPPGSRKRFFYFVMSVSIKIYGTTTDAASVFLRGSRDFLRARRRTLFFFRPENNGDEASACLAKTYNYLLYLCKCAGRPGAIVIREIARPEGK